MRLVTKLFAAAAESGAVAAGAHDYVLKGCSRAELIHAITAAAAGDDLTKTVDYFAVSRRLLRLGEGRSWKLIEKLAVDIATTVLDEFSPESVSVEVKKFILPETRHVSVKVERSRPAKTAPGTAHERVVRQVGGVPAAFR